VLLAGHSYGGAVMTNVDPDAGDVVALIYVPVSPSSAGRVLGTRPRSCQDLRSPTRSSAWDSLTGEPTPTSPTTNSITNSPPTYPPSRAR
jgi:pimeloyl-ACP methyl ester carboxylesterase